MKLVRSKAQLAANLHMGWVHAVPEDWIKLLGVAEILGAIGLVPAGLSMESAAQRSRG
jgi:hypothetical protein